jgi:hypothetical protein
MNLRTPFLIASALVGLSVAAPAVADSGADDASLCVNRPGLATPPCTLKPGEGTIELGMATWDHTGAADGRTDTLTLADTTLRWGLGAATEIDVEMAGHVRQRTRDSGGVDVQTGRGDATIALRHGFGGNDAPAAIQAFVTLPTGTGPGTAGDWGAGVLVPLALPLPAGLTLELTPEADAAVNASGTGRHFAYGSVVGLAHALGPHLSGAVELAAYRDNDPDGASTDARAAVSVAWQAGRTFQLDVELDHGLATGAPDSSVAFGMAWKFR